LSQELREHRINEFSASWWSDLWMEPGMSGKGIFRSRRASLGALGLLLFAFGGCGESSNLRLPHRDVETIDRIYNSSSATLKNVSTDVRVLGDGAVEIVERGDEVRRSDEEGDGTLWLPVVLAPELPEYYEAKSKFAGRNIELEAYRLDGGLWCIAAVEGPPPANTEFEHRPSADTDSEGVDVVLYSKRFVSDLPFLIPAERHGTLSNISISLPARSRFYSTEIEGQVEPGEQTAPRKLENFRQRESQLTELPPSIAQGLVKAAGETDSADVVAWDFSKVSFWVPGGFWQWRPWFLPSALSAVFAMFAIWLWYYPLGRGETRYAELESAAVFGFQSAVIAALNWGESGSVPSLDDYAESHWQLNFLRRSTELLLRLKDALFARKGEAVDVSKIGSRIAEIEYLLVFGWDEWTRTSSGADRELNLRAAQLREVVASYRTFDRIREERRYAKHRVALRQIGWILAILALASAIWFLATLASGQAAVTPPPPRAAALAEMKVLVIPHDQHDIDRNKVDVILRFYPLTELQVPGTTEIGIDSGAKFTLSAFSRTGDTAQATVLQQTDHSLRLAVRASYSSAIRRQRILANGVTSFVPSKVYLKSIEKADRVEIKYTVEGSQQVKDRAKNGWLYLFPFDSVATEVPLGFDEFALLSQVELKEVPDLEGNVWLAGPNISLEENEERTRYRIAADDDPHRIPVWPGKDLRVIATFERKPLQKYGLTVGMLVIAILLGLLVGKLMSMNDSGAIQILVGAVGILGLPLAVRAIVFEQYRDLPTIAAGVGITVFECAFLVSIALLAIVSFAAKRWFK